MQEIANHPGPIVILTGAGISAESGLGTFRDVGGLWTQYDLEQVATPQGFARDPALVHDFYNARRANLLAAEPNAAHTALVRLAAARPVTLITQNIDDLHERAGSNGVIHMHGELMRKLCAACDTRGPAPAVMRPHDRCPTCGASALRPDVVWFGEIPYHMDRIEAAMAEVALFAAIGTSGEVYPAAGLAAAARAAGAHCVELNLEPSHGEGVFHDRRIGPATEVVPAWVEGLLGG
ncbi:MAG: NAD-dependent deacylase [Pseudomonadota bacterium]